MRKEPTAAFANVSVSKHPTSPSGPTPGLSSSRSYSFELTPQLIYSRSALLQYLVSSKVYRQLEFLAVGSWWIYSSELQEPAEGQAPSEGAPQHGRLLKVPSGREDVFQDQVLDFKAKRALMKFLRFIVDFEEQAEVWEGYRTKPFPTFLSEQFKVPVGLHPPLLALTLSPQTPSNTSTEYALRRIARHLRSIGVFGPGFGAVLPKWGGMSEVVQVACRSCAVGGGVYVLGKGLSDTPTDDEGKTEGEEHATLRLKDGETVSSRWIVKEEMFGVAEPLQHCKSVSIVSSALTPLFPQIAEEAPSPASSVVVFPSGSLSLAQGAEISHDLPPVHIFVHSSDTGECPSGQSVLYASTSLTGESGFQLLKIAVDTLLHTVDIMPRPTVLWSMQFEQRSSSSDEPAPAVGDQHVLKLPSSPLDLAFDDDVLDRVKSVWQQIVGEDGREFLVFEDREANADDNE
ncbi:FAD/NAD(P)-binding domain-containing protein [Westerdykella ornata]|uniref:FAD/NAD(P)-binding domain-containing protein n=1 Tax=Westerdykella ornata TaxID=318751 RepID=A0A6A6JLX9_WESOR|nr:FAD/NAD(P)-binding domain-containing protein [Westerdykella ornata]KAF2277601.1 FAD/NAD(P)-binding domain-containing protein [Westerdykella ornata]